MADLFSFRTGFELLRTAPVASGVVIEIGDHLKISGGKMTKFTAAGDNLTFYAVAKEAHVSTDPSGEITVAIRNANSVYELTLDAATDIAVGDDLASDGTAQVVTQSSTDRIAVAVESKLQATTIRAIYNLPATTGGLNFVGDAS